MRGPEQVYVHLAAPRRIGSLLELQDSDGWVGGFEEMCTLHAVIISQCATVL
jgi:hypothetical protein